MKPTSWSDHHKLIDPHVCVRGTEFKKKTSAIPAYACAQGSLYTRLGASELKTIMQSNLFLLLFGFQRHVTKPG